ncbi:hypothetical protein F5Y16DRAFT_397653 [Xylariaceae sp. FL0255]|nr:hypothetical protein F5Y16DRAFT_397653 [Xylariaceae sp. FL0255]
MEFESTIQKAVDVEPTAFAKSTLALEPATNNELITSARPITEVESDTLKTVIKSNGENPTFPRFRDLPVELRLLIWKYSFPVLGPAVFKFMQEVCWKAEYPVNPTDIIYLDFDPTVLGVTQANIPLFDVNWEARNFAIEWAQKQGIFLGRGAHGQAVCNRPFDGSQDALHVPSWFQTDEMGLNFLPDLEPGDWQTREIRIRSGIERVVLRSLDGLSELIQFMRYRPSLGIKTVLLTSTYCHHDIDDDLFAYHPGNVPISVQFKDRGRLRYFKPTEALLEVLKRNYRVNKPYDPATIGQYQFEEESDTDDDEVFYTHTVKVDKRKARVKDDYDTDNNSDYSICSKDTCWEELYPDVEIRRISVKKGWDWAGEQC